MAMTPEDFDKLKTHLAKFVKQSDCPVCLNKSWRAVGPSTLLGYDPSGDLMLGGDTIPLMHLICNTCFYVRSFAWQAILNEATNG